MIERDEKFGGTVKFDSYQKLEEAYAKEEVYPLDLKNGVAFHLNSVRVSVDKTRRSKMASLCVADGAYKGQVCQLPRVSEDQESSLSRADKE